MREGHANAAAVFEYVGAMGDLLGKLHELATIQKLDATGSEEELTKIMPGFGFLSHCTTFYFKEIGLPSNDALCFNFHFKVSQGAESEFKAVAQQALAKTSTEEN